MVPSREQRVCGVLLGAVVGDAFGSVLEGISSTDALRATARRAEVSQPWGYTDDGAMTLAVAESLIESRRVDPTNILARLVAHFDPVRGFGKGMRICLEAFSAGRPWHECAYVAWAEGSRGNGAAARVAPVACVAWADRDGLGEAARLSAIVSHAHSEAVAGALLQAHAVAGVLFAPERVDQPRLFLEQLAMAIRSPDALVLKKISLVGELIQNGVGPKEAARQLGTSTLAMESVPAALWAFLAAHGSFQEAVVNAALLGGDVDTICSMVGALAGALHGSDAIPATWLENMANERPSIPEMLNLAHGLCLLKPETPSGHAA